MGGEGLCCLPGLLGQGLAEVSHGFGTAQQPDRAILRGLLRKRNLGRGQHRCDTFVRGHELHLTTGIGDLLREPVATGALRSIGCAVAVPAHDQHAVAGADLVGDLLPQGLDRKSVV